MHAVGEITFEDKRNHIDNTYGEYIKDPFVIIIVYLGYYTLIYFTVLQIEKKNRRKMDFIVDLGLYMRDIILTYCARHSVVK